MEISSVAVDERARMADRIRRARRAARLSQGALAAHVGVTPSAVAQWEHPHGTCPVVANLRVVAAATDVNFQWLATGHGHKRHGRQDEDSTPALKLDSFAHDTVEEALLHSFRSLSPRAKHALVMFLQELKTRK
jgi:transcriptional regulator with XRE-family HTH domain